MLRPLSLLLLAGAPTQARPGADLYSSQEEHFSRTMHQRATATGLPFTLSSLEAAAHEGAQLLPGLLAGLREQFHNASRSDEYQTQVYSSGWPTSPDRFERIGNMYMTSPMALRHAAAQIEHLVSVGIMDASFVSHADTLYCTAAQITREAVATAYTGMEYVYV
mmetsp:Transcript_24393/g.56229  ORF Transcript_24393/g.56229 Transcript_24393/m.56229 type:complete len:164 (-) Transcript_24393:1125-1616(-)